MKAAVMQPYFFPYIGYFQLINAVDIFVVYDDVNFIKKGWINRNSILVNEKPFLFTMELKEASQNKRINEILTADSNWRKNLVRTIGLSYKKAPYFDTAFPIVEEIILNEENNLAEFLTASIKKICSFIGIRTNIMVSSEIEKDNQLKGADKIRAICKTIGASDYINAIGGMELYDRNDFSEDGIRLQFLQTKPIKYAQFKNEFTPWLSIIDVMMFNSADEIKRCLDQYELI
jgi:hypothetical protein